MADYNLNPPLLQAFRHENIRRQILSHLRTSDQCRLRQTSCAFSNVLTRSLFAKVRLTFTPSSLSRQCRIEALGRIGHHIKHFTFSMHHSDATFLPPLLNPKTGQEINFLYTPHTSLESEKERPQYGNSELGNTLMAQYPAIFHAATNVPAFIRALTCMFNLEHISVSCADQQPTERYRRSAVDYALISLRIAIERAELPHLTKLSLACHPAALLYLHPTPNYGASPLARRRWRQIKNLKLSIDSWPFDDAPLDHLKLLSNYLLLFSGTVEKLTFHWYGQRGPCPLTMAAPPKAPSSSRSSSFSHSPRSPTSQKLFAEITSPMSPLPLTPPADALHFERLRRVQARNTFVTADQISTFITRHASSIKGMDFDNVVLTSGTWDDALLPLGRLSSKEAIWEARHSGSFTGTDNDLLSCGGSSVPTPAEEEENPYRWDPRPVLEDERRPLRESYVESHMASSPSHVNIAKKHKRRRRRHTSPPPPPPASLRREASHLLGKLKKEASQSSFFSMFKHHDSAISLGPSQSLHSINRTVREVVVVDDEQIFLATPRHNRAMPSVPTDPADYFDLAEHYLAQPAYEPEPEPLLQPTIFSPTGKEGVFTPPQTPTKQRDAGTPKSQIWEFDRPRSLASISEAPLLAPTIYSPVSPADAHRHPLDRRPTMEDVPLSAALAAPLTPPESPMLVLSPTVYTPPSSRRPSPVKNASPAQSKSPCRQGLGRESPDREERVRGQAVPRPPMVKMPALTPMLAQIATPVTPWPSMMSRSMAPKPLKIDTNIPAVKPVISTPPPVRARNEDMNPMIQGNQRDVARENRYIELANDAEKRDEVLKEARERVMGRLGRKYSGRNPNTSSINASLATQGSALGRVREGRKDYTGMGQGGVREDSKERVDGGRVQDAVRREMWMGIEREERLGEVVGSEVGVGRGRSDSSELVPFMIMR